ncbi:MAG: hypothetical protein II874_00395 [Bacteroidales bacterium]|nr:hypothetical protein [Bacteroidales bacterium]
MTDLRVLHTLENKIHSLNRKVRIREERLSVFRKENKFLIRNSFRLLGKLYYTYLTTGTAGTNQLREIWKEACGNTSRMDRLVRFLDKHSDHLIRDLRSSVPSLGDDEVVLYCCFAVGFDAPLVSELTGVGVNTVYSRKKRMIDKILKLGPKRARRFLDLLE